MIVVCRRGESSEPESANLGPWAQGVLLGSDTCDINSLRRREWNVGMLCYLRRLRSGLRNSPKDDYGPGKDEFWEPERVAR
ncbi:hypothetical protein K443DRAFT_683097 [Laccaria amethystina LaAM-08-1]|uniref:Uncharacterized protein n=1 Tax=Laccaria amethystina LaAM-08-1 TaxID=1095629 RepID=A0A0C9WJV8_9AGAR|nr:hypothetical protein K443DRAFT_683097 [Laccaria amethystina LaAM-08-1]